MRHSRFHPEISRNIFISNWAVAAKNQNLKGHTKGASPILKFGVFSIVATVLIFFSVVVPNLAKSTPNNQGNSASKSLLVDISPTSISSLNTQVKNDCRDVEDLNMWKQASPDQLIPGIKEARQIELGGTLVQIVQCEAASSQTTFSLQWILAEGKWQLKKISRQPIGMSGNLD